ncbi:Retrotransposon-derived PEG10 [Labeo rohita]|uniref:Retrotransposon-derived PEG10 n=1 Tax=Labeo rohita TaxID=84645 RepID=A0A498MUJ1_LABRO|nr:Retrotransposon-derived PEG10 [Labeo rohita]
MILDNITLQYSHQRRTSDEWKVSEVTDFLQKEQRSSERNMQLIKSAPVPAKRNTVKLTLQNIWKKGQKIEIKTLQVCTAMMKISEGLNDAFKDELYAREVPDRLDDLISLALRLDARRELRRRARMRTEPVASTPLAPSSDESEPMQVDRLRLTAKEKQRRLLEGLCLYCAAQGHHAQSCPVKQSRPPQRVNGSALIDSGAEGNFIDEE